MPIPIILGKVVAKLGTVVGYVAKNAGAQSHRDAIVISQEATKILEYCEKAIIPQRTAVEKRFEQLGRLELEIFNSLEQVCELLQKFQIEIDYPEYSTDSYTIRKLQFDEVRKVSAFASALLGGISSIAAGSIAGLAAGGMTIAAVSAFGTAGTGAAIAGLHGIAATNAILAFLGCGTLASGGAGIAHGARLLDDTKSGVWRGVGGCVLLCTGLKNLKNEKNRYEKICNFKQNIPTIQKQLSDLDLIICECLNLLNKVYDVYKKYLDIMKKVIIDEDRIDWNMYTDFEKMIFLKVFLLVQLFVDVCRVRFVQEPEQGQFIGTINREEIDNALQKMIDISAQCII